MKSINVSTLRPVGSTDSAECMAVAAAMSEGLRRLRSAKCHLSCACALAVTVLAGCTGGANLNAPPMAMSATTSLEDARLALAIPEPPIFVLNIPPGQLDGMVAGIVGGMVGGAIYGAARASSQLSEGDRMAKAFGIVDPAIAIGRGLAARLRASHRMSDVPASATPVGEALDAVISAAPNADMILDVRSQVYGINHKREDASNYFVMSITWARLIDARSKAVIAEARCIPTKTPPTQPLDRLVANNAEAIKAGLAAYVEPCIEQLAAKMKL